MSWSKYSGSMLDRKAKPFNGSYEEAALQHLYRGRTSGEGRPRRPEWRVGLRPTKVSVAVPQHVASSPFYRASSCRNSHPQQMCARVNCPKLTFSVSARTGIFQ